MSSHSVNTHSPLTEADISEIDDYLLINEMMCFQCCDIIRNFTCKQCILTSNNNTTRICTHLPDGYLCQNCAGDIHKKLPRK